MNNTNYYIKSQISHVVVRGIEIEFEEEIAIDPQTEEEIYLRELEIENDRRLYDQYKAMKELLQSHEIKSIRDKYNLNQKDFAKILGLGDITIHRYENGTIQTDATDAIIRFVNVPSNMEKVALKNKNKLSTDTFQKLIEKIKELKLLYKHRIAEFDYQTISKLSFETTHVEKVAEKVIEVYNNKIEQQSRKLHIEIPKITNLELQKLLYYTQGLCLLIFNQPAFNQHLYAWDYGPITYEIYIKYKKFQRNEIETKTHQTLSVGLEKVIDIIIDSYNKYSGGELINLTHEEEPWKNTPKNKVIDKELIKDYFEKVYHI